MARPRKPTRVLELSGAFDKDPQRRRARAHEPEPTGGLGDPPKCLDETERARWGEIAEMCPWARNSDRILVEQTCRLWTLERRGKAKVGDSRLLQSNLVRLGMTPADRSRVQVPGGKAKPKNAFGALTG